MSRKLTPCRGVRPLWAQLFETSITYYSVERELKVYKADQGCRSGEFPDPSIASANPHRNNTRLAAGRL